MIWKKYRHRFGKLSYDFRQKDMKKAAKIVAFLWKTVNIFSHDSTYHNIFLTINTTLLLPELFIFSIRVPNRMTKQRRGRIFIIIIRGEVKSYVPWVTKIIYIMREKSENSSILCVEIIENCYRSIEASYQWSLIVTY